MEQLLQNMNALSRSPSLVPRPPPPGGKQPKARELSKLSMENRRGRPHFCDVCGKNFTSQHGLNMHRLIHTSDKPHRCGICGKCFIQQGHLNNHKRIHMQEKHYTCDICGIHFPTRETLRSHKALHIEEHYGLYICDVCGEQFTYSRNLRRHLSKHCDERLYNCDFCGKQFKEAGHLRGHVSSHTGGKKPYKCGFCGLQFTFIQNLRDHSMQHNRAAASATGEDQSPQQTSSTVGDRSRQQRRQAPVSVVDQFLQHNRPLVGTIVNPPLQRGRLLP